MRQMLPGQLPYDGEHGCQGAAPTLIIPGSDASGGDASPKGIARRPNAPNDVLQAHIWSSVHHSIFSLLKILQIPC